MSDVIHEETPVVKSESTETGTQNSSSSGSDTQKTLDVVIGEIKSVAQPHFLSRPRIVAENGGRLIRSGKDTVSLENHELIARTDLSCDGAIAWGKSGKGKPIPAGQVMQRWPERGCGAPLEFLAGEQWVPTSVLVLEDPETGARYNQTIEPDVEHFLRDNHKVGKFAVLDLAADVLTIARYVDAEPEQREAGDMTLGELALHYAENGIPVFPLTPGSKIPLPGSHGFKDATADPAIIRRWWALNPDANIGFATGTTFNVVDVDVKDGTDGSAELAKVNPDFVLPETLTIDTPTGGQHLYYSCAAKPLSSNASCVARYVDIRGKGGLVVAPGSWRERGCYVVEKALPLADQPKWLPKALEGGSKIQGRKAGARNPVKFQGRKEVAERKDAEERTMLDFLDPNDRMTWIAVGFALKRSYGDLAQPTWLEWSQEAENSDDLDALQERWCGFNTADPGMTFGALAHVAREHGYQPSSLPSLIDEKRRNLIFGAK